MAARYNHSHNPVRVVSFDESKVSIEWDSVEAAHRYIILNKPGAVDSGAQFSLVSDDVRGQEQFDLSALVPGQEYTVKVLAEVEVGVATVRACGPVANVSATKATSDSVSLAFSSAPGATSYRVESTTQLNSDLSFQQCLDEDLPSTATTAEIPNLQTGVTYRFRVVAVSGSFENPEANATCEATTIGALGQVEVGEVGEDKIVLRWAKGDGASVFKVEKLSKSGKARLITDKLTETRCQIEGLHPGVDTTIRVTPGNVGQPFNDDAGVVVTARPLGVCRDLTVTEVHNNRVGLSWAASNGASSYRVHSFKTGEQSNPKIQDVESGTQCVVEYLNTGDEYTFQVFAGHDGIYENKGSNSVTATPLDQPTGINISHVTARSVRVSWNSVYGATRYMMQHSTQNAKPVIVTDSCTTTELEVDNLIADRKYRLSVFAGSDSGFENNGDHMEFTTLVPPSHLAVAEVTATTVALTWQHPNGNNPNKQPTPDFSVACARCDAPTEWALHRLQGLGCNIAHLLTGVPYTFKVFAGDGDGVFECEGSNLVNATPLATVDGLRVTESSDDTLSLSWQSSGVPGERYRIEYGGGEDGKIGNKVVACDEPEIKLVDLRRGERLLIRVFVGTDVGFETVGTKISAVSLGSPRDLRVTGVTGTTVSVGWALVAGATRYVVETRPANSQSPFSPVITDLTAPTYMLENLETGEPIEVRVRAAAGEQEETEGTSVTTTPLSLDALFTEEQLRNMREDELRKLLRKHFSSMFTDEELAAMDLQQLLDLALKLLGPNAIRVKELTDTKAHIEWNPCRGATRYKVERSHNGQQYQTVTDSLETPECVIQLPNAIDTNIRIFIGSDVFGNDCLETKIRPLSCPTGLKTTSVHQDAVELQWNEVRGAEHYTLYVTRVGHEQHEKKLEFTCANCTVESLESGIEYNFKVFAGAGKFHETIGSKVLTVQPLASPDGVRVTGFTSTSLKLVWQPVFGATRYRIVYVVATNPHQQVMCSDSCVANEFEVDGLSPGTPCQVFVFAGGEHGFETEGSSCSGTPLRQIGAVTPNRVTAAEVALSWQEVEGASEYLVVQTTDHNKTQGTTTTPNFSTTTGLLSGRPTTFEVFTGIGDGVFASEPVSVTVTPLPTATNLRPVFVTDRGVRLQWNAAAGATKYRFEYRGKDSSNPAFHLVSDSCTIPVVELGGLKPGREYQFRVFSGSETGFETEGCNATAMPLDNATNITITNLKPSLLGLSFTPPKGSDDCRIELVSVSLDNDTTSTHSAMSHNTNNPRCKVLCVLGNTGGAGTFDTTNDLLRGGEKHTIRIVAGREGVFQASGVTFDVKPMVPVQKMTVVGVTDRTATLEWEGVEGARGYLVEWQPTAGGNPASHPIEDCTLTVSALRACMEYEFKVRVGTEQGFDSGACVANAIPLPPPSNLVTQYNNGVVLAWDGPHLATRYRVEMRLKAAKFDYPWQVMVEDHPNTNLHLADLHPFVKYAFRVFAGSQYCYETVGVVETMEVILEPRNPKELERAVDKSVALMLKALEAEVPGISLITFKVGPNLYKIGAKTLALTVLKGMIVCRVGGGYEDLALWILNHKDQLLRFIDQHSTQILESIDTVAKVRRSGHGDEIVEDQAQFAATESSVTNPQRSRVSGSYHHDANGNKRQSMGGLAPGVVPMFMKSPRKGGNQRLDAKKKPDPLKRRQSWGKWDEITRKDN